MMHLGVASAPSMNFDFSLGSTALHCDNSCEWWMWRHANHSNSVHMDIHTQPLRVACLGVCSPDSNHVRTSGTGIPVVNDSFICTKRHKPFINSLCHTQLPAIRIRGCVFYLVWID